ncbi:response regulator transcription factor [Eggerthella sinensis]|nr:helix-turn-helix transcriptional regulator [Eggerthella sinensis]
MNEMLDRFTGNISPVALLVSSFFWSWFDVVPFSPALFSAAGRPVDALPFIVSFAASALLLGLLAASARARSRVLDPRVFAACSLLCGTVGSVLVFAGVQTNPALLVIGGILIGAYQSVGAVLCGGIATCQGTTNALVHLAAALPLNIVAILLVMFLQPAASVVFAVLLPLFSALCYAVYLVRGQNRATLEAIAVVREKAVDGARRARRMFGCDRYFLLMVLVISASFGFANYQGLFASSSQGVYLEYVTVALRAFVSLAMLAGYLLYSWRPYLILQGALVAMSLGLIGCGLLAVMGVPGSFVSDCLFFTGYACFDLLIWMIIIMIGYKSGTSLLRIICVVYTVDQLGILLGTVLGQAVGGDGATIVSYIVFGSALLLLTVGFSSGKSAIWDRLSTYEVEFNRPDDASLREEGDVGTAPGYQDRIAALSSMFFLTSRETDVLGLLVAGRNGPYISEHLHVSENTVKSHIRHIYTKVNVHNRQELLDLVFPQQS